MKRYIVTYAVNDEMDKFNTHPSGVVIAGEPDDCVGIYAAKDTFKTYKEAEKALDKLFSEWEELAKRDGIENGWEFERWDWTDSTEGVIVKKHVEKDGLVLGVVDRGGNETKEPIVRDLTVIDDKVWLFSFAIQKIEV